jgi:putative heme-binding domain-containing protein
MYLSCNDVARLLKDAAPSSSLLALRWLPLALAGLLAAVPASGDGIQQATPAESIRVPTGFVVERIHSVPLDKQGSWVSLTAELRGRLIASDQEGSLYRITPGRGADSAHVERIELPIGKAHGLEFAAHRLYVVVNGDVAEGSGLYVVRDTDGDDRFDRVQLLKPLGGRGEHGPHAVRLGPDGMLYVLGGNHTRIPLPLEPRSPHRNWDEDLLLPRNADGLGHATGVMAPGGWVARTDLEGQSWELLCGGFRNAYDVDFHPHGELFTYDADMEWDSGTPWYRPTRVNHAVSAGEFGWRFGTGKWPDYYVDSVASVVDIGFGSPTGVCFGTGGRMPARYQQALFLCDWTYGRIYAVHLVPRGASYDGTFEVFAEGKPLPVTDILVHPYDGALYFTIGGRGTQSGLYRIRYEGAESTATAAPLDDPAAAEARHRRRRLESFHGRQDPRAVDEAWPELGSADRAIRYAARVAIEHQDPSLWRERVWTETRNRARIQALLALIRSRHGEDTALQSQVLEHLTAMPLERLGEEDLLDALRVCQLAFIRLGGLQNAAAEVVARRLDSMFPAERSEAVNRELFNILVYVNAPGIIERGLERLVQGSTQQDQMFYAFVLRNIHEGWTRSQRETDLAWLNLAEQKYVGGASFQEFVRQIRRDTLAGASDAEKSELAELIEGGGSTAPVGLQTTRQFVHNWQMADLETLLPEVDRGRSFEQGKRAYHEAQCGVCHRFAGSGGATGPDITGVGNRFTPMYLLEAMIVPSKVISDQYRASTVLTSDGEVISGRVIADDGRILKIHPNPFAETVLEIPVERIESREPSAVSEMPAGLINVLKQEEILDLIAYLRSAGNPTDAAFEPTTP